MSRSKVVLWGCLLIGSGLFWGCEIGNRSQSCDQPSAPVTIQRDDWGVPHVRARTLADAAYGQGYAQAQDRLLQIDLLRRTAKGSRAELLGADELEMDRLVRTLSLTQAAQASLDAMDKETLCWVDAFAGGINRYIDDMVAGTVKRSAALDALDPGYVPPRWERIDVVIVATAATFSLSSNLTSDLVLTASRLLLGDDLYDKLVRFDPLVEAYTITDPAEDKDIQPVAKSTPDSLDVTQTQAVAAALGRFAETARRLRDAMGTYASNNWAVQGKRTERGFSMLASDPHGSITIPSSFHEIHLLVEKPPHKAYGIAVAGGPMVHIGHNGKAAWAFTNYGADVGDLYEEVPAPGNDDAVLRDGLPVVMETRDETILVRPENGAVANAVAETLQVRTVPGHGPILTDVLPEPLPLLFIEKLISYRWVGAGDTMEARALANLLNVTTWAEFLANAEDWHVGAQNTIFADALGNVGYHATGLFPARPWVAAGLNPIEPLPGDGGAEWQGVDPFTSIRTLYNPDWGFVSSANGDPAGFTEDNDPFAPEYLGYVFDFGFRTHRIKSQLTELLDTATLDDMAALQNDVFVGFGVQLQPLFTQVLTASTPDSVTAAAIKALSAWDYMATTDSVGAAVFHQIVVRLVADYVAEPVLGALRPLLLGNSQVAFRALVHLLESDDSEIFPDGRDAAIQVALRRAVEDLGAFFGTTDTAQWRWGAMHVRTLAHPLGGDFTRGPYEVPGGFAVVNRSDFHYLTEDGLASLPYEIADGPDMRLLVELEPGVSRTWISMPHGSSGDPDSAHYDDQLPLWLTGEYREANYLPAQVDAAVVSEVELR